MYIGCTTSATFTMKVDVLAVNRSTYVGVLYLAHYPR